MQPCIAVIELNVTQAHDALGDDFSTVCIVIPESPTWVQEFPHKR